MSAAEDWDPTSYDGSYTPLPAGPPVDKPERWYRDNAAVFYALEEWQRNWDDHASDYEGKNGRPLSSMNREKNKAAFRRKLIEAYGRGEPDGAWVDQRISMLEKRGMAPDRSERFGR